MNESFLYERETYGTVTLKWLPFWTNQRQGAVSSLSHSYENVSNDGGGSDYDDDDDDNNIIII